MTSKPAIQSTLQRYQSEILTALRRSIERAKDAAIHPGAGDPTPFYGQMQYHLGWVDASFSPVAGNAGKLWRPTLLLLAYEAAGAANAGSDNAHSLRCALPAAVAVEAVLDRACLVLVEGQHLDISFETRDDISVSMYVDMISRKTAALMGCAAEMGALLGTRDQETIDRLRSFGYAMGIAFQVRDDILGVWASTEELGKTPAGDIYRRKKSLPVLHALEYAEASDQQFLRQFYSQKTPITSTQVEEILAIFERTHTKEYCCSFLIEQCRMAHEALANVPRNSNAVANRAISDMETLVHFVEEIAKEETSSVQAPDR